MADRVIVYNTNQAYLAEIIKEYLADNGIIAFTIDKRDSSYLFGDIEVYVETDDVMRAKLLINKFEA